MKAEIPPHDPLTKVTGRESEVSKRAALSLLCALFLALTVPASAQQPKKIPTVGHLVLNSFSTLSARVEAFRQGLHDLGEPCHPWKNIYRSTKLGMWCFASFK